MCPSIRCPQCGLMTYHRGICENVSCGYDPLGAEFEPPYGSTKAQIPVLMHQGEISVSKVQKPFPMVRFSGQDLNSIQELAKEIGFNGPIFEDHPEDLLMPPTVYGFDLVKDNAQIYHNWGSTLVRESRA